MLWELRYKQDGFSIESGEAKGREPPQWYLDEPERDDLDNFLLGAFYELGTTRRYAGGPVPWDCIMQWCATKGLAADLVDLVRLSVLELDTVYLKHLQKERENG